MSSAPTIINLDQYHTNDVLKLIPRAAGTYTAKMAIRGNSLLSSIFVKAIDPGATVKINYYDTTTGNDSTTPERYELVGHDLVTDADLGSTFRITVPRIHNKPQVEAIVTGGSAEFGVYISVVSTIVSDLDVALVRDGDTWVPNVNKGIPTVCLDRDTGLMHFMSCKDGKLIVSSEEPGDPTFFSGSVTSIPDVSVTVLSFTVPVGTLRNLKRLNVVTDSPGSFSLLAGGSEIEAGILYEARKNIELKFDPSRPISEGTLVELKYLADTSPSIGCPVKGFLSALDVT